MKADVKNLLQVIQFGAVGCTGMVVDFGVTWLCREELHWNPYAANTAGFVLAVVNNYLLNRYWTFNHHSRPLQQQFLYFLLIAVAGLLLNSSLLYLLRQYTPLNFYLCKLLATGIVFVWNYTANTRLTFSRPV